MARPHHHRFAKSVLPQLFFAAPGETIVAVSGAQGKDYLSHHWNTASDAPLPHHGLEVLGISQAGAHQVVIIAMPPALEPNEAIFVALVMEGTSPSVYFYERCSADGVGGSVPHDSQAVLAMQRPASRANRGFFEGLTLDAFRSALGRSLGVEVPSPVKISAPQSPMAPPVVNKGAPLFPLLKAKDWHAKALALTMPLPGVTHPDAPCVAFARNMEDQYVILTLQEAGDANPTAVFHDAVKNLSAQPADVSMMQGVAVCGGSDFAADRLVDPNFFAVVQNQLGSQDLYVCAPHRRAIYAISASADNYTKTLFGGMVSTELTRSPPPGAPVSDLLFRVNNGRIVSAHKLQEVVPTHAAPAQPQNTSGGYGLPGGSGSSSAYGLPNRSFGARPNAAPAGMPAGAIPAGAGGAHDRAAARAAGIAAIVTLLISSLSTFFFAFTGLGAGSVGGFVFWIACGFLIRVPASRPAAIVALVSSFFNIGTSALLYDSSFGLYGAGAIAAVTMGAFAWGLGKACSPPKIGIAATVAVVALSLLWLPMVITLGQGASLIMWLRLFVLLGLAGYVVKENS
ncbi:MAG: hypothetical protein AB8H86_26055 [Polyangiales bacterium]